MNNFIQDGLVLNLTAPYTVAAGDGAKIGSIFGVATSAITSGDDGDFQVEGVFELTKTTSQAWTQGQRIYWNDSTYKCTSDSTAGMLIGYATAAAGSSDTTGFVKVCDCAPELLEGAEAAVADLAGTLTGTVDGTMVDVEATAGSCAGGSSPTASNVDTAIATAVASIVTGVNTQNKELLTKVNALLAALRLNGVIST